MIHPIRATLKILQLLVVWFNYFNNVPIAKASGFDGMAKIWTLEGKLMSVEVQVGQTIDNFKNRWHLVRFKKTMVQSEKLHESMK